MTMHLGRTITTGVITAALLIGLFAAMNADQPLRTEDTADPSSAPGLAFALLALLSVFSVAISFGRRSSMHERQIREKSGPAPALTLFSLCWSATNIGLLFAAIAEAFNRDRLGLSITAMVLMGLVAIGIMVGFFFLPEQPTGTALTMAASALPAFLIALIGALNMLRPDEKLLLHFKSERTPEPQLLIATNQRFVRASILGSDRTFILEQASPGQLAAVTSHRVGHDLMTTAHFHGRRPMRIVGGDPNQSRTFAEAVSRLARTGQVRR